MTANEAWYMQPGATRDCACQFRKNGATGIGIQKPHTLKPTTCNNQRWMLMEVLKDMQSVHSRPAFQL
jgi:hypothetical protein